ncbi:MAG TPA: ABC transporter permease [Candidatus Acidoferrum sp.]
MRPEHWLYTIPLRLRSLFRRGLVERELNDELKYHLEQKTREYIADGLTSEEARRKAMREFGGIEQSKERCRDTRRVRIIETILQDARFAFRVLRKSSRFTLLAVFALALGVGASSVMFSAVDSILLRPLPYRSADRLVVILNHGRGPIAPANYVDWKAQSKSFDSMGAAEYWTPDLTGVDRPSKLWALHITPDILPMLGIPPMLGRSFIKEEEQVGQEYEVVLSYALWQRQFGGDRGVLGRQISLDGKLHEIVGVMPAGFQFAPFWATKAELWAPLALGPRATQRGGNSLRIFARLAPGVGLADARAELATITARLERQYPGTNRDAQVVPLKEKVVGKIRPALLIMQFAVAFVLLIACANVAHMLLARGAARAGEAAVRSALGAGRFRLIQQFLTESLMLAIAGGILGLLLAVAGIRALVAFGPADIPRIDNVSLDWRVTLFTVGVSLATGVAFGLAPARQASRLDPAESLKEGGRSGDSTRGQRTRSLLVVTEFALALMLLIGAGLMLRTLLALQAIDPGFDPHNVLTMVVSTGGSPVSTPGHTDDFYRQMLDRVRAVPGVVSAGLTNHLPLAGDIWGFPFWIEGQPIPAPGEEPDAAYRLAFPGYFKTMAMQIVRGRPIEDSDTASAPRVVVINEYLARRYWPDEDPIGKHLALDNPAKVLAEKLKWLTVVGVVKNAVRSDWAAPPEEEIFLPYSQNAGVGSYLTLVARTAGDPAASAVSIETAIWSVDRNVTVSEVQTMDAVIARANSQSRFNAALLATFAVVALIMSAVGIYGVMTYAVTRRRHEIGVRMALGASRANVLGDILTRGMALALAGSVIGVLGGLILSRLMAALLYGVQPSDLLTFSAAAALLIMVALAACYVPARHATRVDPVVALRYE